MNLKVLITRPLQQAQQLCEWINTSGGEALLFPTLEILPPKDKSSLTKAVEKLADFDIAIFTSANAVFSTMPYWPTLKSLPKIIAIGPGTAKALAQFDIAVDQRPEQNFSSETLLQLPELQQVHNKAIVIFTGEEGRTLLSEELASRGGKIFMAFTYRRAMPQIDPKVLAEWKKKYFDIIICTSRASLQNLVFLLGGSSQFFDIPLLVGSKRLQIFAQQSGFSNIIVAADASDQAIFTRLKTWYAKS